MYINKDLELSIFIKDKVVCDHCFWNILIVRYNIVVVERIRKSKEKYHKYIYIYIFYYFYRFSYK